MQVGKLDAGALLIILALSACSADQPTNSGESQNQEIGGAKPNETFNQRVARQTRPLPTINREQLPAPEGAPAQVALKAINGNAMKRADRCPSITRAERFDSDGNIIATCRNGQNYRIFRVEGISDTFALNCKKAREQTVVDPCDADSVRMGHDDSIDRVLAFIAKV
jgi:hypothetical protein